MAAQGATQKVKKLPDLDVELAQALDRMHDEAKEAERRATDVAAQFEGKKTAILREAREVKQKATEMMQDYLDRAADALDGFEFLTMAEAGEDGDWEILRTLNERARVAGVGVLVAAGCGSESRRASPPPPRLPAALAVRLASQSDGVAHRLQLNDGCGAL